MRLIDRAIDICVKPRATFLEIEREKAGFTGLYRDYLLWLAALPVLVKLAVGWLGRHPPRAGSHVAAVLAGAALDYICLLAGVYILALAIDALAPLFGGERDEDRALRLCAYALTPTFLASATGALPGLAWTSVLGLYSIALVIIGLPRLMRCADDRALAYGASAAVAMAAIALATSLLTSRVLPQS
ncbi:MAG: Yip1 family protein [Hyphomicrobiales bacterium]